jgi:hypothetical protein
MLREIRITIRSIAPILMNRYIGEQLPMEKPKKKTQQWIDDTHKKDWMDRAYFDSEKGFHIPPEMIEGMLIHGAKKQRQGELFKEAVAVVEDFIPLIVYNGPEDTKGKILKGKLEDYYKREHIDLRGVVIQRARVDRCRPIFRHWGIDFTVRYDNELVEESDIRTALRRACLGDFRPRFGRCRVTEFVPLAAPVSEEAA